MQTCGQVLSSPLWYGQFISFFFLLIYFFFFFISFQQTADISIQREKMKTDSIKTLRGEKKEESFQENNLMACSAGLCLHKKKSYLSSNPPSLPQHSTKSIETTLFHLLCPPLQHLELAPRGSFAPSNW